MNKSAVVEWYDDVNPDSYVLCMEPYGIKILHTKLIDENQTEVVVYGPEENVDRFLEDFEEDTLEPLEEMQSGDYDDEDYEAYLNNEVNRWLDIYDLCQTEDASEPVEVEVTDHIEVTL